MLSIISAIFIIFISFWKHKLKIERLEKENEEKFFSPSFNNSYDENDSNKVNMSNLRLIKISELELGKIIGRGAFGTVYEGYYRPFDQSNFKVKVAIKVLKKTFSDEKAISRLSDELINVNKYFLFKNKFIF